MGSLPALLHLREGPASPPTGVGEPGRDALPRTTWPSLPVLISEPAWASLGLAAAPSTEAGPRRGQEKAAEWGHVGAGTGPAL